MHNESGTLKDPHIEVLPQSISKCFGALCLFMILVIVISQHRTVNQNAMVLLTAHQKYHGYSSISASAFFRSAVYIFSGYYAEAKRSGKRKEICTVYLSQKIRADPGCNENLGETCLFMPKQLDFFAGLYYNIGWTMLQFCSKTE